MIKSLIQKIQDVIQHLKVVTQSHMSHHKLYIPIGRPLHRFYNLISYYKI